MVFDKTVAGQAKLIPVKLTAVLLVQSKPLMVLPEIVMPVLVARFIRITLSLLP